MKIAIVSLCLTHCLVRERRHQRDRSLARLRSPVGACAAKRWHVGRRRRQRCATSAKHIGDGVDSIDYVVDVDNNDNVDDDDDNDADADDDDNDDADNDDNDNDNDDDDNDERN